MALPRTNGSDLEQPLCPEGVTDVGVGHHFTSVRVNDLVSDIIASVVFWLFFFKYFISMSNTEFWIGFSVLALAMIAWRFWRASHLLKQDDRKLPYSCVSVLADGCEVFLVATVHISPKSPKDVKQVISEISPDLVMIELDPERLERLRGSENPSDEEDLQPLTIDISSQQETLKAQRAIWNQKDAGSVVQGPIVFMQGNAYGNMKFGKGEVADAICLVQRGSGFNHKNQQAFAPFALKAFNAAAGGAKGVLIIDTEEDLPKGRMGTDTLVGDIKTALAVRSGGLPPIPALLLKRNDGLQLKESVCQGKLPRAEFTILTDDRHPCRSLRSRLCQTVAMFASGIGVLYGVIKCFAVEVGGEFVAADAEASARGVTCVCVDVTVDRLWNRFAICLRPFPRNLAASLLAWLSFPRALSRSLFPPSDSADVIGIVSLNVLSFTLMTWVSFAVAGYCAGTVISMVLQGFSLGVAESEETASGGNARSTAILQQWITFGFELYALPRVYEAIAASRDEAMYCGIAAGRRKHGSAKVVFVCGAAHANGIIRRIRERGL